MIYSIRNLQKRYAREHGYVLDIQRLDIRHGAMIAITGPSGCGKSTLLDILGLALCPDRADRFSFRPVPEEPDLPVPPLWEQGKRDILASLRLRYIGYILQTGGLLPFLNVQENIILTARLSGMTREEAMERACPLAEQLGIAHLATAMPASLSVGERQRAAIVRALTPRPSLILADEPTAALDPAHASQVMEAFLRAVTEQHTTLIMVTHNREYARRGGLRELPFHLETSREGTRALLDTGSAPVCEK